jgi:hypothetical protein
MITNAFDNVIVSGVSVTILAITSSPVDSLNIFTSDIISPLVVYNISQKL